MIREIESNWRETGIDCPDCHNMTYSDGRNPPTCPTCQKSLQNEFVWGWLINSIGCSVCEASFHPKDDSEFVCPKCQEALGGHCACGSDDVHMEWGVREKPGTEKMYYYWAIECACGVRAESRLHNLGDADIVAKELHKKWLMDFPKKEGQE